jgi:pyruvate, orthophosphate dikinase
MNESGCPRQAGLVYAFDYQHRLPAAQLAELLGGKGASLAAMTALRLPVPPGFTIATGVPQPQAGEHLPEPVVGQVFAQLGQLAARAGRRFGDDEDPLLLSVRSGAPVSMPGMMDTVLNLGITEAAARALARAGTDEAVFAWDIYARFVRSYALTVLGLDTAAVGPPCSALAASPLLTAEKLEHEAVALAGRVDVLVGDDSWRDPRRQVVAAITAVLQSWDSVRARAFRAREGISANTGTAVNIQQMVFGNRDEQSGTGVAFSRDPSTGTPGPYGDFLSRAQGEDVVAGSHHPRSLEAMAAAFPAAFRRLSEVLRLLEVRERDLIEVEFTIESGRLWLLQSRRGRRTGPAALRIAADMAADPDIALQPAEAVLRITAEDIRQAEQIGAVCTGDSPIATGIGVTPGAVTGHAYFDTDRCLVAAERGTPVILVRPETSPADVAGMAAAAGLLTSRGGRVSHAAVIARAWGKVAICGAVEISVGDSSLTSASGVVIREGDILTLDGSSGRVYAGALIITRSSEQTASLAVVRSWCDEILAVGAGPQPAASVTERLEAARSLLPHKPASASDAASERAVPAAVQYGTEPQEHLLVALRIRGRVPLEDLGAPGLAGADTEAALRRMARDELCREAAGSWRLTPGGRQAAEELVTRQRAGLDAGALEIVYAGFMRSDTALKAAITDWQVLPDGRPNSHKDPGHDASVLDRVASVHQSISRVLDEGTAVLPRLWHYRQRLDAAWAMVVAGDTTWLASPVKDSYHTVWFQLHEDLLLMTARQRGEQDAR